MIAQWLLLLPLLAAGCQRRSIQQCQCENIYFDITEGIGCHITEPAQPGFKCECNHYHDGRYCTGKAHPCRNDEWCPGGRYSYCACVQGGGKCNGYPLRNSTMTVESCSRVNKLGGVTGMRRGNYDRCECEGHRGGCRVMKAAPEGFKCYCIFYYGYCYSRIIGCNEDEYCPPGDHSYCACLRGGGDCEGYRDKNQVCDLGNTCDCNRTSDWTNGRYTIVNITIDQGNVVRSNPKPLKYGELDLPNASGAELNQVLTVTYANKSETNFKRTHGVEVEAGLTFKVFVPKLTTTHSFEYGNTTTTSSETSYKYSCTSPPKTHTHCTVHLVSFEISAPYTMVLKHSAIPDCTCRSYGTWTQKASFLSTLKAEYVGPCLLLVNGSCVTSDI